MKQNLYQNDNHTTFNVHQTGDVVCGGRGGGRGGGGGGTDDRVGTPPPLNFKSQCYF